MQPRIAILILFSATVLAGDLFVSPSGSDSNDGLTAATPLRSLQKAADAAQPGDVVNVMDGEYTNPCAGCSVFEVTAAGTPDSWIAFRAAPGSRPRLVFNGWNGILIKNGAAYIEISGFEIQGNRADVTFDYCRAEKGNNNPLCNGNGIMVDGRSSKDGKPHHIRIAKNEIWQCNGGGIAVVHADYLTIEDNTVHENSWYSRFANSGISIYQPFNFDDNTGVRNYIRRNRAYNNRSLVEWMATGKLSDGNGIIIDDSRNRQNGSTNGVYQGRTRVENNLTYDNGGGGITVYSSDHVDVYNNTAYRNGQVVGYADIFVNDAGDVAVVNNVAFSRPGVPPLRVQAATGLFEDFNLLFNQGAFTAQGPNDLVADPWFVKASTQPAAADFHLILESPAVLSGTRDNAPADDLEGNPRPASGPFSRGAYEPQPKKQPEE